MLLGTRALKQALRGGWIAGTAFTCGVAVLPSIPRSDPIPLECSKLVSPIDRLSFANNKHKVWYETWWDGQCTGLSRFNVFSEDFCVPINYSRDFIEVSLNKRHPSIDRKRLIEELCSLGQMIGLEWARHNSVRCVDSNDVQGWKARILGEELPKGPGADVLQVIAAVKTEAKAKIARASEKGCAGSGASARR